MSDELLRPDLCVIGAGSGGLSVAAAAAAMGVPVVLVEKGEMGGDCLNYGCVPSKSLIAAAHVAHIIRRAPEFGIRAGLPDVDGRAVLQHVRNVVAGIAPTDSQARFEAMGVRVIRAAGRFVSRTTLEAGAFRVQARRFIVATGSSPRIPRIPGLETIKFLTNESIFDLDEIPARLVVIGGGPVGLEIAQAWRRLGAGVTVIEADKALAHEDPEFASLVTERIVAEGVDLLQGARIIRIEPSDSGARLLVESNKREESIDGSHVLIAAGREPNVDGVGLEAAGVAFDRTGIKVGRDLRSTNRRIYAVGDVAGGAQSTHAANYHAGLVLRATLFRLRVRLDAALIPRVTYTDPELAVAGIDEGSARRQHRDLLVLRWPFAENDRARADRDTHGHIKIIATRKGRILGAGIVGPRAGELIGLWQLAIARKMSLSDIGGLVLPYPTLSEVSRRAAIVGLARGLRNPWLPRALRFLRRFG